MVRTERDFSMTLQSNKALTLLYLNIGIQSPGEASKVQRYDKLDKYK